MTDRATWDRLRAALDGWEAPRGLRLCYAIDERSGRIAFNLQASCGGGIARDFAQGTDAFERFVAQPRARLDSAAVEVLHDHMCCEGRPPRLLAYGERVFRRWVGRYRHTLDARRARRTSPWR